MRNNKSKIPKKAEPVDTLVIVGNGFDCWQGLDTDYGQFEKYYFENQDHILQKLGLKKSWSFVEDGVTTATFSDAEIIYGNPFDPGELGTGFWHRFEDSLHHVDSERLNAFFGKEDDDLDDLDCSVENAQMILREAFCDWISTVSVEEKDSGYHFGNNCLFINFNYTDTLEKRFGIPIENIFHIHGEATEKEGIVFGHSMHPQLPVDALYDMGGRFRGLYLVEQLLYETDKHAYVHYVELLIFLARRGVKLADIRHIYVLGHSFGVADREYFEELACATGAKKVVKKQEEYFPCNPMEELHLMIGYVILTYGNDGPHPEIDAEAARRFARVTYRQQRECLLESIQTQYRHSVFKQRRKFPNQLHRLEQVLSTSCGTESAKWHISYRSEAGKQRIESVLRDVGIENYEMYSSIDGCIDVFKKNSYNV